MDDSTSTPPSIQPPRRHHYVMKGAIFAVAMVFAALVILVFDLRRWEALGVSLLAMIPVLWLAWRRMVTARADRVRRRYAHPQPANADEVFDAIGWVRDHAVEDDRGRFELARLPARETAADEYAGSVRRPEADSRSDERAFRLGRRAG